MKKVLILFVFIFLALPTSFAIAQFNVAPPTSISIELNPDTPGPNQQVSVTLDSYATNLNLAKVSWYVNGKNISSGTGLKTFSFTMGGVDVSTTLKIVIETAEGETINKEMVLKPSTVDLIWQADGFVPPFYKGKTLFSHQNKIQFVAIPHIKDSNGNEVPVGNLVYKWTRNGTVLGDFSGYGKNTYTMISSIISRPLQIDVEVTSPTSDDIAKASTVARPIEPMIFFYQKSPLYGIQFEKALTGEVVMTNEKEMEVLAEPFFFGVASLYDGILGYKWSINGTQIDGDLSKPSRLFVKKEGTEGTANISVSIENSDSVLQFTKNSFNLKFQSATTNTAPTL